MISSRRPMIVPSWQDADQLPVRLLVRQPTSGVLRLHLAERAPERPQRRVRIPQVLGRVPVDHAFTDAPAQERAGLRGPLVHGVVRRVPRRAPRQQVGFRQLRRMPSSRPAEQVRQPPAVLSRRVRVRVPAGELVQQRGDVASVCCESD